jgi:phytoene synthase
VNTAPAYARCESITRAAAGNFYWGIRLLPREKRRGMCAIYAFARRVDDIGDGELAAELKRTLLQEQSQTLELIAAGQTPPADPVGVALADSIGRFELPADALSELIEGVRMDLEGIRYERFEDLLVYCRRVAGGIGRLSLAVFGSREPQRAFPLAEELGVALQLTNILRDIREDAEGGRVYLPLEELERFGVLIPGEDGDPAARLAEQVTEHSISPQLQALMRFQTRRAREWFKRGGALVELLDRRSAACVLAMSGIYRRVLERIDEDPAGALRHRTTLPAHEKALVAARSLLGAGV